MTAPQRQPAASVRMLLRRLGVGALVVLAFVYFALRRPESAQVALLEVEVTPLPATAPSCRLERSEALAHARSLEQMAMARWERVPFALREAPRAALQMAEAEACFEVASDREGRMRSAAMRRSYNEQVERRFARARLLLRAAVRTRAKQQTAQIEPSDAHARRQVETLLALLDRAPPSAEPYRAELTRLSRRYAAQAADLRSRAQPAISPRASSYEARR